MRDAQWFDDGYPSITPLLNCLFVILKRMRLFLLCHEVLYLNK